MNQAPKQHLDLAECKRCGKRIASMKKPPHTSKETFDRFSGICTDCFTEKEKIDLVLAMKNDMMKNLSQRANSEPSKIIY